MPKRTDKQKNVGALVPPQAHETIEQFAKERGANVSGIVRVALVKYLNAEGLPIKLDDLTVGEWGGNRREKEPA